MNKIPELFFRSDISTTLDASYTFRYSVHNDSDKRAVSAPSENVEKDEKDHQFR